MDQVIEKTPVQIRLNCNEPDCQITFKNQGNMEKHTGRFHKIVSALSSSPLATSVRTLSLGENSSDTESPSIQGNSEGFVNVQEVVSEADFLCGQCNKRFETNTQAKNHMNNKHDKAVVAEANDVSDDTEITNNVSNNDKGNNDLWVEPAEITNDVILAEELERIAIIAQNAVISGSNCDECKKVNEVVDHKEKVIKDQDNKITTMQTRIRKADEKVKELSNDRKKMVTENNKLKKELKECQEIMAECQKKVSSLTVELATKNSNEDDDSNQNIKCPCCDMRARNMGTLEAHVKIMHAKVQIKCKICNNLFDKEDNLKLHLVQEHKDEIDCIKCMSVFRKEAEVYSHSNNCSSIISLNICHKCEKNVVSRSALKKHKESCQGKKKKSQVPCRNGISCRFLRSNKCSFAHPQPQAAQQTNMNHESEPIQQQWETVRPRQRNPLWTCRFCSENIYNREASRRHGCKMHQTESVQVESNSMRNRKETLCWWGPECQRVQNGTCWFKHIEKINMLPHQGHVSQGFPQWNLVGYQN